MKDQTAGRPHSCMLAIFVSLLIGFALVAPGLGEDPEYSVEARLASRSLLLDAALADGSLVAVGERGHILISDDGGKEWRQAKVPTRATLTAVHFQDANHGWAVGHDSVILRTEDGGQTWERVNWDPEAENPFMDVWFSDLENGFAIGAYGSFFETSDGGASWSPSSISEDDFHLHHMARASDGRLYVAAEGGLIFRSDDDGATWVGLTSPYGGSFFGSLPLDGDNLLVFGLRGHLFRSEDAGETWTGIDTGTVALLNDGIRLADGTIVIAGLGGVVLVSHDGGKSFELNQQESRRGISSLIETKDGQLLMVGEFGTRVVSPAELLQ